LLEDLPDIEIVGEATDGVEAANLIRSLRPDAVLLDLQMPGLDGFQVAGALGMAQPPAVIFVTAYDQHALEAFNAGAVDYLLKPVRRERLSAALSKARAHLAGKAAAVVTPVPAVVAGPAPVAPAVARGPLGEVRKIVGRLGSDLHLLDPSEVIAFQAEGELVYILTGRGKYYANQTLRALEDRLPAERFRRIHRSTIINADHIRKISPLSSKRWLLRMSNGMEVVVSKRLAAVIREEMNW
jgi:DNA-binding LytR/AlgR family response regulator